MTFFVHADAEPILFWLRGIVVSAGSIFVYDPPR